MGLVLLVGCASTSLEDTPGQASGGLETASPQEVLAALLTASSPARFLELQRGLDMPRVVEALDDWSAVRLGALGPLRSGAHELNRKRAAYLLFACEKYGLAHAQVFSLFLIHSAFDDDLREVLALLARDRHLAETWGHMPAVHEALRVRGLRLADYPERPERLGDMARGAARAASEALSSSELSRGLLALRYSAQRAQLPTPYQDVLNEVERAETLQAFSTSNLVLGGVDTLTFGVPLGFYNLVAGTCHGVYALSQGHYEQSGRELSAAAVLVALYAGGKGIQLLTETGEGAVVGARMEALYIPEVGVEGVAGVAQRLWAHLGPQGMKEVARYIQAQREAAVLVYEGGEPAALALHEARGDVARAQAWLAEARSPPASPLKGGGKGIASLASLLDEASNLPAEVVQAKLEQVELGAEGPRLSADVAVLEQQRPRLEAPPLEAEGHPLWGEYVAYWERRLEALKQGQPVKPPLSWEGYGPMRGVFARGLAFERHMVALLREDATLPRARRRWLGDFHRPRIETNVGVVKPGTPGVRYADVLVIEEQPPAGQPPRVETFSFKSRDFSSLGEKALKAQMITDADEALRYYGGILTIRRRTMVVFDHQIAIQRVRLIYEGGKLKPMYVNLWNTARDTAQATVKEVEVLVQ